MIGKLDTTRRIFIKKINKCTELNSIYSMANSIENLTLINVRILNI